MINTVLTCLLLYAGSAYAISGEGYATARVIQSQSVESLPDGLNKRISGTPHQTFIIYPLTGTETADNLGNFNLLPYEDQEILVICY